jgi:ElaA protein
VSVVLEWRRFDELSAARLYELLRFRQQIFVVEQGSPYADLDGRDEPAQHLLLSAEGALVGYLRLIPSPDPPRVMIGRVAIAPAMRGRGLGRRLMREALRRCDEAYPGRPVALSAQSYLVPFYAGFGFAAISAPYDDFGVPHVDMVKES